MTQILPFSNISHQITLGGISIRRDPFGRYSLNDLHRAAMEAGNANEGQRPSQFLRSESVQAFIAELDSSAQICADVQNQQLRGAVFSKAGPESNGGGTWAHELVAIRYAAWINPAFEVRVYQAFRESVAKPAAPALPHDYLSALEHLIVSEKGRLQAVAALDQATTQLTIAAPKAEALDRLAKADGDLCITNAAKALGLRPKDLFAHLQQEKWIYRRVGGSGWVGYQSRIQVGYLTHKVTTIERSDGTEKAIEQVLVTPKGLAKLAIDLNSKKAA